MLPEWKLRAVTTLPSVCDVTYYLHVGILGHLGNVVFFFQGAMVNNDQELLLSRILFEHIHLLFNNFIMYLFN